MSTIWEAEAIKYGADPNRVQVWDALADMFLDTSWDTNDMDLHAKILADSPFTFAELMHILYYEVTPNCWSNLFFTVAGEWFYSPDWLIPSCLKRQHKHPFYPNGLPDHVPFFMHLLGTGPASEAYFLLYQAKRVRQQKLDKVS